MEFLVATSDWRNKNILNYKEVLEKYNLQIKHNPDYEGNLYYITLNSLEDLIRFKNDVYEFTEHYVSELVITNDIANTDFELTIEIYDGYRE